MGKPRGKSGRSNIPSLNSYAKSQGSSVDITSLTSLTVKYKGENELESPEKTDSPA